MPRALLNVYLTWVYILILWNELTRQIYMTRDFWDGEPTSYKLFRLIYVYIKILQISSVESNPMLASHLLWNMFLKYVNF